MDATKLIKNSAEMPDCFSCNKAEGHLCIFAMQSSSNEALGEAGEHY